jgi:hypothetical protein
VNTWAPQGGKKLSEQALPLEHQAMLNQLRREAKRRQLAMEATISKENDYGTAAHYLFVKSTMRPAKDLLCGVVEGYLMLSSSMRERKETESYLWGKLLMGDMGWAQEDLNVGDLLEQPVNEHVQLYGLFGELAQRLKSAWDCVSQAPEETAKGHGVRKEVVLTLNGKAPDEVSEVVKTKRMQSNQKVTNQLCAGKYVLIDMQARIT